MSTVLIIIANLAQSIFPDEGCHLHGTVKPQSTAMPEASTMALFFVTACDEGHWLRHTRHSVCPEFSLTQLQSLNKSQAQRSHILNGTQSAISLAYERCSSYSPST